VLSKSPEPDEILPTIRKIKCKIVWLENMIKFWTLFFDGYKFFTKEQKIHLLVKDKLEEFRLQI
jgi:hypothetical protein